MKKFLYFIVAFMLILQTGFLSGIPAHAEGDVTETPTLEPTQPPEPTATETASPTAEPTGTPAPSETASPIPSSSETPTMEITETPPVIPEEITLSLTSDPPYIKRGGELYLEWSIGGVREITKGTFLRFYLPKGLKLIDPKIGTLNEEGGVLDIEVIELIGKVGFIVGEEMETPLVITAEFLQEEKSLARAAVSLLEPSETLIESTGGSADGMSGRVVVNFPENALSEKVKVTIARPSKESLPINSLSSMPFEITAVSEETKAEVSEFATPIEIQVAYTEAGMADENDLLLYWYDPSDGQWKLPLSQRIDLENNILYAYTNHFTVFDTYNANWQTAVTPTLDASQTSAFTGAGSYSIPIKVPPGPGGFQPNITLSYSSAVVDNAGSQTQASWVGMGWSLTTSYIERNGHGTNGVQDDSYNLNLNGMSVELFPGADGKYHASNENFYKVEYLLPDYDEQQSSWKISDKTGNVYYFEDRTNMWKTQTCPTGYDLLPYVWRWSLTRVENLYGQVMEYTYQHDNKTILYLNCDGQSSSTPVDVWVYPYEIKYPDNHYRIRFIREASRLDYRSIWASPYTTYTAFQKSKLTNIRVEQVNGDGSATLIRRYDFTYYPLIFPDYFWEAGGRTLTLRTVQEVAANLATLPPYTFYYDDKMHLSDVTNGYGGTASYEYDNWHESMPYDEWQDNLPEYLIPEWGNPVKFQFTTGTEGWAGVQPPPTSGVNFMGAGSIGVWGVVGYPNTGDGAFSFQPGRWYVIIANARTADDGINNTMQLGFREGKSGGYYNRWGESAVLTSTYQTIYSEPLQLSKDAISFAPRINSTGYNQVRWLYIYALPTAYRVTSRTLTAGGTSYAWNYDYSGAATNIPINPYNSEGNSEAAAGPQPYIKPYTEFRGHSMVTETDPYGKVTVTYFDQSDCLTGSVTGMEVYNGGTLARSSSTSYTCDDWDSTLILRNMDTTSPGYNTFYDTLKYYWSRTSSQTSNVHDAGGTEIAHTTTNYGYNASNGNLTYQTVLGTNISTLTTRFEYYSYTVGGKWLIGLPDRIHVKQGDNILAEAFNLYEDTQRPGVLTGTRTWVSGTQYSQANFEHDDHGNMTSQTAYSGYWDGSTGVPSGARTTTIVYDTTYHTYPISITNPLGQTTTLTYDYAFGVPLSETGPNGLATKVDAEYDVFGRLTKLIRPGNSSASPTLRIVYTDSNPYIVTMTQKISDTQNLLIFEK